MKINIANRISFNFARFLPPMNCLLFARQPCFIICHELSGETIRTNKRKIVIREIRNIWK